MDNLLKYKSLIKATIIAIIVSISASQMTTYAGTPIPQAGWSLWSVDSSQTSFPAINAIDGNPGTHWITEISPVAPLPHDYQVDLGASYNIDGFRYLPRQDFPYGRIIQYEFYVSVDGNTWGAPMASGSFGNNATEKEIIFNTPKTGQYVWLKAISEQHGYQMTSMAELNVLETTLGGSGSSSDCPDAWSKTLTTDRFELVLPTEANPGGEAVLDHETCLVWEQSPNTTTRSWPFALTHCYRSEVGGRGGWRMPTIEELASLKDTVNTNPALPSGHPFDTTAVQFDPSSRYWSATSSATSTGVESENAYNMRFNSGNVGINAKAGSIFVWCVRSGQGIEGQ